MRVSDNDKIRRLIYQFYTPQQIPTEDGTLHTVFDAKRFYTNKGLIEKYLKDAQRIEPVYVWRPKAGDSIPISDQPAIIAQGNETVFLKKLGNNGRLKIYIPAGSSGNLAEATLDAKYEKATASHDAAILAVLPEGARIQHREPKVHSIDILHECMALPAVILHARGKDQHQFMQPGDSLKFEDGECLPLPKTELDFAWRVTQKSRKI